MIKNHLNYIIHHSILDRFMGFSNPFRIKIIIEQMRDLIMRVLGYLRQERKYLELEMPSYKVHKVEHGIISS